MDFSLTYIISQVFTIIMYILLGITYFAKNKKVIVIFSMLSLLANIIAYVLLNAYTGMAMCIVAMLRNIYLLYDEKINGKSDKNTIKDYIVLGIIYALTLVSTVFTYDGILSLLSVAATSIYTYSIWQKNTKIYKFCGIPVGILWIAYNIYVKSLFGIILEAVLLVASIIGYISAIRMSSKSKI